MTRPTIALLTDFGTRDTYAGVMKGVIASIAPEANVVDLTHGIGPQDVEQAAFLLAGSWRYFPAPTIFVCVVDPGVGSDRRIVCLRTDAWTFLAPDNGLLHPVATQTASHRIFEVTNRDHFLPVVSDTFHGRDIFAPVAAHLANGLDPAALGQHMASLMPVAGDPSREENDMLLGRIAYIDTFGNAVTNIPQDQLEAFLAGGEAESAGLVVQGTQIHGIHRSYAAKEEGEGLGIVGSFGYLEIAVNRGSAAETYGLSRGDTVNITR